MVSTTVLLKCLQYGIPMKVNDPNNVCMCVSPLSFVPAFFQKGTENEVGSERSRDLWPQGGLGPPYGAPEPRGRVLFMHLSPSSWPCREPPPPRRYPRCAPPPPGGSAPGRRPPAPRRPPRRPSPPRNAGGSGSGSGTRPLFDQGGLPHLVAGRRICFYTACCDRIFQVDSAREPAHSPTRTHARTPEPFGVGSPNWTSSGEFCRLAPARTSPSAGVPAVGRHSTGCQREAWAGAVARGGAGGAAGRPPRRGAPAAAEAAADVVRPATALTPADPSPPPLPVRHPRPGTANTADGRGNHDKPDPSHAILSIPPLVPRHIPVTAIASAEQRKFLFRPHLALPGARHSGSCCIMKCKCIQLSKPTMPFCKFSTHFLLVCIFGVFC